MRTEARWSLIGIVLATTIGLGGTIVAAESSRQLKQARKVLDKVKLVDGPGSGLDADTVHGMTPTQIQEATTGLEGPAGPQGPPGPQGPAGPAGGGGVRVVDSAGRVVGVLDLASRDGAQTIVLRQQGSVVVSLTMSDQGFVETTDPFFYHSVADCSDPRGVPSGGLVRRATIVGTRAYYASDPLETREIVAEETDACFGPPNCTARDADGLCCCRLDCVPQCGDFRSGPPVILDLTTLGLVPPFHVEGLP